MSAIITEEEYQQRCVAQSNDGYGYEASGYVCVALPDGRYAISDYSHCSCYDTWESLTGERWGDDLSAEFPWVFTKEELVKMAENCEDFAIPGRRAEPDDYDYQKLHGLYTELLEHFAKESAQ